MITRAFVPMGLALALAATSALPTPARAATGGCLKYGLAGAIAGHVVHHGVMGAVGGCMAGIVARHKAREDAERKRTEELNAASARGGPEAVADYQRTAAPLPAERVSGKSGNGR